MWHTNPGSNRRNRTIVFRGMGEPLGATGNFLRSGYVDLQHGLGSCCAGRWNRKISTKNTLKHVEDVGKVMINR